uniref:Uncharacterized protein n=1 Tax=Aegilops tauschii subsp. strangulata TaxID=200361 RepID=A0A453BR91_AEGTS
LELSEKRTQGGRSIFLPLLSFVRTPPRRHGCRPPAALPRGRRPRL